MKRDKSASFKQSTVLPWVELRIANQSNACYDAHSHDEFSFGIIQQGRATYKNRNQTHNIGAGDLVTINPADVHSCNPEKGTWSYSMLFVDALKMGQLQTDVLDDHNQKMGLDYRSFNADFERSKQLNIQYLDLFRALNGDQPSLHIESCLYRFIAASLGHGSIGLPSKRSINAQVQRVQEKLLDEVNEAHELESLAQEAGMNRYQLLRAFKSYYGLPPYAYLMDEKIKRSKQMLKAGQSLADIALQLGFSDQAHFQRQFKKRLAVTPKYYQSHFVLS